MFVVRNVAQVPMGRRDEAVGQLKEMLAEMTKELGAPPARVLTASVGPSDSTIVSEQEFPTLAAFEEYLEKANGWPGMERYGGKLFPLVVPGTNRFEIYRLQS